MQLVYESPVNVCDVECNKSISSFSAASGECCPSLRRHNSRNFCAWLQRVIPMQINKNSNYFRCNVCGKR